MAVLAEDSSLPYRSSFAALLHKTTRCMQDGACAEPHCPLTCMFCSTSALTSHATACLSTCRGALGYILCKTQAGSLHVARLGVTPTARRQGVGRALLEAALTTAPVPPWSCTSASLVVACDNVAAIALYRAARFQV
jgi:GNAT superfamily N-acetyltransferase